MDIPSMYGVTHLVLHTTQEASMNDLKVIPPVYTINILHYQGPMATGANAGI